MTYIDACSQKTRLFHSSRSPKFLHIFTGSALATVLSLAIFTLPTSSPSASDSWADLCTKHWSPWSRFSSSWFLLRQKKGKKRFLTCVTFPRLYLVEWQAKEQLTLRSETAECLSNIVLPCFNALPVRFLVSAGFAYGSVSAQKQRMWQLTHIGLATRFKPNVPHRATFQCSNTDWQFARETCNFNSTLLQQVVKFRCVFTSEIIQY